MEQPISGMTAPGPSAPRLPARATTNRRRLLWLALAAVLIALFVYSWVDVGGSISQFFTGMFGNKGLFQNIVPQSVPPDSSQIEPGVRAALTHVRGRVPEHRLRRRRRDRDAAAGCAQHHAAAPLYLAARLIQGILRSIPELIMLLFFLIVFGFSPFAAVVALTFHGIGVKGKLFAEAVEEMDMAPVEALRAAGASRMQVFMHAVLPGVRNTLTALTLYRLDANFRSAVTLGAVGGGGIGFLIDNELNAFQFKPVTTYIIILVVFVMAIEQVSTLLRSRLLK